MPPSARSWSRRAITLLAICTVAFALVLATHYQSAYTAPLRHDAAAYDSLLSARNTDLPSTTGLNADERCRMVHQVRGAAEQCAFIHENCPQDEGGFSTYLDIHYCRFPHIKWATAIALALWLCFLFATIGVAASDFFCPNLGTVAQILGMEESLTGVTFLAFGNGSPDVFSTFAAMSANSGSLAVGELFGAAGFISAVVLGIMAIIHPFKVSRNSFLRDVGFFAVAVSFSLIFLLDGKLHMWECLVMVGFYLLYVGIVIYWHIWVEGKRKRQEREAAARGHFVHPEDEIREYEAYHDDPDGASDSRRPSTSRELSGEDWAALERGEGLDPNFQYEDIEEGARRRWMSQFVSGMRLTGRARRNTSTLIRPSLMGVLEFQAVLKSLEKSRNMRTISMDKQQHPDHQTSSAKYQDQMSTNSDPLTEYDSSTADEHSLLLPSSSDALAPPTAPFGRARAVSANDAVNPRLAPHLSQLSPVQSEADLIDFAQNDSAQRAFPAVLVEPATPRRESPIQQARGRASTTVSRDLLAPPDTMLINRSHSDYLVSPSRNWHPASPMVPRVADLPRIVIPRDNRSPGSSRSTSPFPPYRDHQSPTLTPGSRSPSPKPPSLHLPNPIASPESIPVDQTIEREVPRRPSRLMKLWPSKILPPPSNIVAALVPAFDTWNEKGWLSRALGLYSAISVFFLSITLPVEAVKQESEADDACEDAHSHSYVPNVGAINGKGNTATNAMHAEQHRGNNGRNTPRISITAEPEGIDHLDLDQNRQEAPELWDRWLTIIQLFLAPILIVLSIYMQTDDVEPRWLIRPILICLLISTVLLIPLLLTTTPTYRPACYRWILSSIGFVVAIAWISAIASEVVGVLKALAVIFNMSHAIMGLTVFAMGNSLGDLASDITVAKFGYPIMALAATFAGPMMNILLGIGLSGTYRIFRGEERRRAKHPEKGIRFKTYHIEVSRTLIVSGITLLITLAALLILVPLNKWMMDRKMGYGLILLWALSTLFNVLVETTGLLEALGEAFCMTC